MTLYHDLLLALQTFDLTKVETILSVYITNINEIDVSGNTALYHSCLLDFSHSTELLLKAGANPNIFNENDDR